MLRNKNLIISRKVLLRGKGWVMKYIDFVNKFNYEIKKFCQGIKV